MTGFIDIHCHILPGLDDGAKDRGMMEEMLKAAYNSGTRTMLATSHYNPDIFPYSLPEYEQRLMLADIIASDISEDFVIKSGNEVFYTSSSVDDMLAGKIKTLADSQYVLIEFAPYQEFSYILRAVRDVTRAGFSPVIAHAERYETILEHPEQAGGLIDAGAYIQVNASHVLGTGGKKVKNAVHRLFKKGDVHFVASDVHNMSSRSPQIHRCAEYICEKYGETLCRRVMIENPGKIISQSIISG